MASPFSIFRKRQKLMMAILCLLAIVSFVFLPYLSEFLGGGSSARKPVVKTSKFGNLYPADIQALLNRRQNVFNVLTQVLSPVMQGLGASPAFVRPQLEATFGPVKEEAVVDSWLLARHAQQMGMVVSNDAVIDYLTKLTQNLAKAKDFQNAFKGARISEGQFLRAMSDELAARQLRNMFYISLGGLTPAERWECFAKVKQMATIEAVPVPVANYVDRVKDPSEEELKTFFDENKEKYQRPDSPEPGFHEPQKIAVEYFKADLEQFAKAVTDEEIQQRYEKNKDAYDQLEKKPEPKITEGAKDGNDGKESTKDTKDTKELKQSGAADGKETKQPPEPNGVEQPDKVKEPEKAKQSKDSSAVGRPSPFMFASLLQEEKSTDEAAKKVPAEAEPPKQADAVTGEKKPADKPEAKAAPAAGETKSVEKEAPTAQEKPADETKSEAKKESPAAQEKPVEAKTGLTEALRSRIRQEIARERVQKVFDELRRQMDDYGQKRRLHDANAKAKTSAGSPPPRPDFQKLAKEHGLSTGHTELMSEWEAQGTDIGDSLASGRDPVWRYAFASLARFRPDISFDLKGNFYLFWKTDEVKDRVPKFEDPGVREQVLREWKMIHARKLAVEGAKLLAAEADKAKKPLKELFADRPDLRVVLPPTFSWMTFGNVPLGSAPYAARVSQAPGVSAPGEEFMRTVFHLTPGATGVAMNIPQTTAYVIQLTEFTPAYAVLRAQFEEDDFSKYAPIAQEDRQQIVRAWLNSIKSSAGFEWMQKPRPTAETGPSEEEE